MKAQVSMEFVLMLLFLLMIFTPISIESLNRAMTVNLISEQFEAKKLCLTFSGMIGQTIAAPSDSNVTTVLPASFLGKDYGISISPPSRTLIVSWRDLSISCPMQTNQINYRLKEEEYTIVHIAPAGDLSEGFHNETLATSFGNVAVNYTAKDFGTTIFSDPGYIVTNDTKIEEFIFLYNIGDELTTVSAAVTGLSDYNIAPIAMTIPSGGVETIVFSAEKSGVTQKGKIILDSTNSGDITIPVVIFSDYPDSFIHPYGLDLGEMPVRGAAENVLIIYSQNGESLKFYPEDNSTLSYDFFMDRRELSIVKEDGVLEIE